MKGKTQFTCTERKIDKGRWRWAVTYLGETLGTGVVKTQAQCRVEKNRVKAEWLAKQGERPSEYVEIALQNKHNLGGFGHQPFTGNFIDFDPQRRSNQTAPFVTMEEAMTLRPL